MLHHFARQDEIVAAEIVGVWLRDVEARRLMIKRIGVIELGGEPFGELRRIAHPDASDALQHREIRRAGIGTPSISSDMSAMIERTRAEE